MDKLLLVGLSHRTAPLALREQLALTGDSLEPALHLLSQAGLNEVVALMTCNRLEVYGVGQGRAEVEAFLADRAGLSIQELRQYLYIETGEQVVKHLMRVAAGLDSMILGEQQILGQVQAAFEYAQRAGTVGPVLSHLFALSTHAGKRARSETEVSCHTTSISHAAVQMARAQVGDLTKARALVIGGGEMSTLAVQALHRHGIGQLTCINRTFERAQSLAVQFEGHARPWDELRQALAEVDIVVTATSAPHAVIQAEDVASPLVIVDIALPRDVASAACALPGLHYYDLDALKAYVEANLARREAAIANVDHIIDEETSRFAEWLRGRSVAPVISALRAQAAAVAEDEVEAALRRMGDLDESQQKMVELLAHRIVNKILHEPTVRLRDAIDYASVVRDLFALDVEEPI